MSSRHRDSRRGLLAVRPRRPLCLAVTGRNNDASDCKCLSSRTSPSTSKRFEARLVGQPLERDAAQDALSPPHRRAAARASWSESACSDVERSGKRIVIGLDDDLFIVLHLMIAGRLHWKPRGDESERSRRPRRVRLSHRHAHAHRSRHEAPRVALSRARRGGSRRIRARRTRGARRDRSSNSPSDCARRITR